MIILSAKGEIEDRIAGLDSGATDYVTKPFSVPELLARIRAHLRTGSAEGGRMRAGAVEIDLLSRRVWSGGAEVALSPREFSLLACFARHPGQALSRERLLAEAWGYEHDPGTNVVDVYVGYLRRKLGDPAAIETVRSAGYRLAGGRRRDEPPHPPVALDRARSCSIVVAALGDRGLQPRRQPPRRPDRLRSRRPGRRAGRGRSPPPPPAPRRRRRGPFIAGQALVGSRLLIAQVPGAPGPISNQSTLLLDRSDDGTRHEGRRGASEEEEEHAQLQDLLDARARATTTIELAESGDLRLLTREIVDTAPARRSSRPASRPPRPSRPSIRSRRRSC